MWPHDWGDDRVGHPGVADAKLVVDPEIKGDHPPHRARGFALDDGTAVIEWQPPENFPDLGGYRILRRDGEQMREIARLGPATRRLVDETVRTDATGTPETYAYGVVALDRAGKDCGSRFAVSIQPGRPDGRRRPSAVGRRREMVFVNGQLMRQVISTDDLKPGTFCVDDGWPDEPDDGQLYLALPAGVQRGACTIEVAVRTVHHFGSSLLQVGGQNLVVRNLVVQHFAGDSGFAAAVHVGARNILIEDCTFRANNGSGLGILMGEQMTVRRCAAEANGDSGLFMDEGDQVLMEDIEVRGNNWRGDWGGVRSGQRAGLRLEGDIAGVVVRRLRAEGNACPGVLVTRVKANIFLDDLRAVGNAREGLVVSESAGPLIIRNAVLARNGRSGLLLEDTSGGVLEGSTLFGNGTSQIEVPPPRPPGPGGPVPAQPLAGHVRGWTWRDNAVVSDRPRCPLVRAPCDPAFLESLRSGRNLWHAPDATEAFRIGGLSVSLEAWHEVTGQDLGSVFAEPRFRSPAALDFRPEPGSLFARREAWPTRPPGLAGFGRLAWIRAFRAETVNAPPYPGAEATPETAWQPLDLRPVANTPLVSRHAWLGRPFWELKPGRQTLHGVPFDVPKGPGGGAAAVALPSAFFREVNRDDAAAGAPVAATAPAGALSAAADVSEAITVPVGRTVREVYVLHGCAFASQYVPAARYELVYADGTTAGIDVVPLGTAPEDTTHADDAGGPGAANPDAEEQLLDRRSAANIQNWDADALHFSRDPARRAMIVDPDDPASGVRYLYTLRWPNPHPDRPVQSLRLASADPQQAASVAVFAVTLRVDGAATAAKTFGARLIITGGIPILPTAAEVTAEILRAQRNLDAWLAEGDAS